MSEYSSRAQSRSASPPRIKVKDRGIQKDSSRYTSPILPVDTWGRVKRESVWDKIKGPLAKLGAASLVVGAYKLSKSQLVKNTMDKFHKIQNILSESSPTPTPSPTPSPTPQIGNNITDVIEYGGNYSSHSGT